MSGRLSRSFFITHCLGLMLNLILVWPKMGLAEELQLDTLLSFVDQNYPELIQQQEKVEAAAGKVRASRGAFDTVLKGAGKKYYDGHYNAEMGQASIAKPLGILNSQIEGGLRRTLGRLPSYEPNDTSPEGDFFVRFSVSLWRFRDIDSDRFKLWSNRNFLRLEKLQLGLKRLDLQNKVNELYWKWFALYQKNILFQELVGLSQDRFEAIKKRVKAKDLAEIQVAEAQQFLVSFQEKLTRIEADLRVITQQLKVFYPQLTEEMKPVAEIKLPESNLQLQMFSPTESLRIRPELKILDQLSGNADLDLRLAEQALNPKLDLAVERAEPNGEENVFRSGNTAMLSLEIPIERNLGRGEVARARAGQRLLMAQQELLKRQITAEIEGLKGRIEADQRGIYLSDTEASLAKRLQEAEWKRFRSGASDFFLINIRDINYANARMKLIENYATFNVALFVLKQWFKEVSIDDE